MIGDLVSILIWWSVIFCLGLLSLPIIITIFSKFWDKGYIFAKSLSLIVVTYLSLVFGIFKIIPFNFLGLSIIFSILLVANFLFLRQKNNFHKFISVIKSHFRIFVTEEIIFLIILIIWSFVRGFSPAIEGLEKYMDWGFVNSALRSRFLPPIDMWFAGEIINYYYFGHLIFALITKLSHLGSAITYNLSIATVCSLTFVSGFSLVSNLVYILSPKSSFKKIILAGAISALLLTFGGNLHPIFKIAKNNYIQNNHHFVLDQKSLSQSISSYWYPDATRFIGHDPDIQDKTIHEFPLYSFVVSDLHGHMNDIFIIIFFMAFLFVSFLAPQPLFDWKFISFSGFILSISYMTNAWDFAVYGLLLAIFTLIYNYRQHGFDSLIKTVSNGLLVIGFWYLFTLPFSLKFIPMMEGIRLADSHSPFYQLFVLYGGFWLISLPFLIRFFVLFLNKKLSQPRFKISSSDIFVFCLILTATVLIIIPELVYIKDIYIYEHRRANTMFKLVYQAFIMYSLASGYVFVRLPQVVKSKFLVTFYKIIFSLVFIAHLIYPYFAIKSYYGSLKKYQGLDGLKYLQDLYPDNYQAILWINQNISGQPVMLEAVGDSYTTFNQVSSATGLPTVQGWVVHEWLWRGGYTAPAARQAEVEIIYSSSNLDEVKDLLSKHHVEYIFIGDKEYEKYPQLNPDKFKSLGGDIVFQSGKTIIYRL